MNGTSQVCKREFTIINWLDKRCSSELTRILCNSVPIETPADYQNVPSHLLSNSKRTRFSLYATIVGMEKRGNRSDIVVVTENLEALANITLERSSTLADTRIMKRVLSATEKFEGHDYVKSRTNASLAEVIRNDEYTDITNTSSFAIRENFTVPLEQNVSEDDEHNSKKFHQLSSNDADEFSQKFIANSPEKRGNKKELPIIKRKKMKKLASNSKLEGAAEKFKIGKFDQKSRKRAASAIVDTDKSSGNIATNSTQVLTESEVIDKTATFEVTTSSPTPKEEEYKHDKLGSPRYK
ncbi:hypothetical protein KIN20_016687 [Parelaphostrongylus tenuis]|uniref:Uncharacterized protein n=1 Tax=Parelaphostrongylus tenuis TaxID=148309 RepID=A0AAD5MGT9_PARTN|nr:hypothetical protein KIN20_016687 [Parelaphostrongylus tenuis]